MPRPRRAARPSEVEFPTRPDPSLRGVWFIRGLLIFGFLYVFFLGGLAFPFIFFRIWAGLAGLGAVAVLGIAWIAWWSKAAVERYTFEVRDDDVIVRHGVVFRTTSRIPLLKVQDIHVRQGPLLRSRGIASLKLETAGLSAVTGGGGARFMGAEGQLPGIRNAEAVAEALLERVKKLKGGL